MIPAPLRLHTGWVRPEWVDYNGHFNDGYYLVAFSEATEAVLAYLGFGPDYLAATGCTIYTAEAHLNYLREVKPGAQLAYDTWVLGGDAKRVHIIHAMWAATADEPPVQAATNEMMFLHVDQSAGKVTPMPATHQARVRAAVAAHAPGPWPAQVGRRIAMPGGA